MARAIDFDRGLAHARGADEQQDLTSCLLIVVVALRHRIGRALPQLTYGQELEDLILHVLETVVILLEDFRGPLQVERLLRPLVPRQFRHRLEVGADHLGFHRVAARPLQPGKLAVDFLARGFGELERLEPLPQVLHLGPFVPFAELLADRLHLLPQEHLTLALAQLFLDLGLDVLLSVEHADLPLDVNEDTPQPVLYG